MDGHFLEEKKHNPQEHDPEYPFFSSSIKTCWEHLVQRTIYVFLVLSGGRLFSESMYPENDIAVALSVNILLYHPL